MYRRVFTGFRGLTVAKSEVGSLRPRQFSTSSVCSSVRSAVNVSTRRSLSSAKIPNGIAASNRLMSTSIAQKSEVPPVVRKTEVTYSDLVELVTGDDRYCLVDVRDGREIEEEGAIPTSLNIPLGKLKASLSLSEAEFEKSFSIPKPTTSDPNLIFYARSSIKSLTALEISHKLGFKKARHYPGGYEEWSKLTMSQEDF